MADEKLTASIRVHMSDALELDIRREADLCGRKASDFIRYVLQRHLYGHRARLWDETEGPKSAD